MHRLRPGQVIGFLKSQNSVFYGTNISRSFAHAAVLQCSAANMFFAVIFGEAALLGFHAVIVLDRKHNNRRETPAPQCVYWGGGRRLIIASSLQPPASRLSRELIQFADDKTGNAPFLHPKSSLPFTQFPKTGIPSSKIHRSARFEQNPYIDDSSPNLLIAKPRRLGGLTRVN